MHIRERGPAGEVKQETVPAKTDLTAGGTIPIRLHRSLVFEICFCGDECLLGKKEELVLLKLLVLAAGRAAVPLKTSFNADQEVTELQIESGLRAANRLSVRFAVSGNVKCGEAADLSLAVAAALFITLEHLVKLLRKIDIGELFVGVEVIETPTDIKADVKSSPIARIDRGLLKRFPNILRRGGRG